MCIMNSQKVFRLYTNYKTRFASEIFSLLLFLSTHANIFFCCSKSWELCLLAITFSIGGFHLRTKFSHRKRQPLFLIECNFFFDNILFTQAFIWIVFYGILSHLVEWNWNWEKKGVKIGNVSCYEYWLVLLLIVIDSCKLTLRKKRLEFPSTF